MTALRLRREILRLATGTMEAAWYYVGWRLAFAFLAPQAAPSARGLATGPSSDGPVLAPSFLLVLFLTLTAIFVARYLDLGQPGEAQQGWAIAAAVGVTMLLAAWLTFGASNGLRAVGYFLAGLTEFNAASVILAVGHIVLWWRAIGTVRDGFGVERTGFRFRIGVVALFWTLIGVAFAHVDVTGYIFVFFTAGLTAMALARVEEVSRDVGGVATPFDRTWGAILISAVLGVMGMGLLATTVLSPDTIRTILGWFSPLWNLLGYAILALVYVLVWLLTPVLEALMRLLQPRLGTVLPRPTPSPVPTAQPQLPPAATGLPLIVTAGLRWLAVAAALALVLWLTAVLARRRAAAAAEGVPELRESVWSADAFAQDARNLLERMLAGLRGRRHAYSIATIRRIYASVQALAADHGAPRRVGETPYEYLPRLVEMFPSVADDLRFLTGAYVDAHYHELSTSDADLARAQAAWARVQHAAQATPVTTVAPGAG